MTGPSDPLPSEHRVRITSPRTGARPHVRRTTREEIDQSTAVGEVYIRSLMRAQLRSALRILLVLMITVGALPAAFAFIDGFAEIRLAGVPLPWLILGVGVYPGLLLLGWIYVRRAERTERAFARLVEPGGTTRWQDDSGQRGRQVEQR
jgi:putative solute:sodium symporter small subunit